MGRYRVQTTGRRDWSFLLGESGCLRSSVGGGWVCFMEMTGLLSGLFVGIVIGLIARLLVPSMQPIGCLMTIIIGVIGGALGAVVGNAMSWGFWLTFGTQILIATILVAIIAALFRRGTP